MNVITKILKEMDEERNNTQNINQNAVQFVQSETVDFDDNNILHTINAGATKAENNKSYKDNPSINIDQIDKAVLDFNFVDDSEMSNNIEKLKPQIDHASSKWGISPNLISAIISQESSGGTSSDNIMQIQFKSHKNEIKYAYDFEQNKIVSFVLTNNVDNPDYNNVDYRITENDLKNKKTAISIGAALLANCMSSYDCNIPLAIQEYNLGNKNIRAVARETASREGYTTNSVYYDQTNLDFTKYTKTVNTGDPEYVKNVVKYLNTYDNSSNSSVVNVKCYNKYTKEIMKNSVNFVPSGNNY